METDRRNFLKLLGVAAAGAPFANACNSHEDTYEVLKLGNDLFLEHDGVVYKLTESSPVNGGGVQGMVKRANPEYDNAKVAHIGNLAENIILNEEFLETLKDGQRATFNYDPFANTGYVHTNSRYPIPQQTSIKSLDTLLR